MTTDDERTAGVSAGMTPEEVVDLHGPPRHTMSADEFENLFDTVVTIGRRRRSGSSDPLGRREPISWFYPDLPDDGSTLIDFRGGVVHSVDVRTTPPVRGNDATPRHEWARDLVVRHVDRVVANESFTFLSTDAWSRMSDPEVLEFVLGADDRARQPVTGRIGGIAQRFRDLTVLVSTFDIADPRKIRRRLPGGYMSQFLWLAHQFRIRPGESHVAHWMLCRDTAVGGETVHLSYSPRVQESTSLLLPTDLLSWSERRQFLR